MKTVLCASAVTAAMLIAGAAAAQNGIQGDWLTEGGEAKVRIGPCEGEAQRVCGRLINPKTGTLAKGPPFITGFKAAGATRWSGGKIRHPKNGKVYSSKMALNPNGSLSVSGCVLVVCQAQTWTRAPS